jgi:O-antigen/teichoic acid export membrane protein
MSEDIKKKAIGGVVWSSVDQFAGQIIQFVISIILARLLVPSDYGVVGMLGFFMGISGVFIDGGFGSALIQRKNRSEKDLNTVFYINIVMATICYVIMVACSSLIADFYNQPQLIPIIKVYCLTLIIGASAGINGTLLTINIDYKTKSKISVIGSILSGIIGIICAWNGMGVWSLVIQSLASCLIGAILNFYFVRWFPKLIFSVESFKSLFAYGSKLLISSIIASAYANIHTLVVGKQFSSETLGYYSRAGGFTNLTSNNVNNIVSRVSFPLLSKIQDDDGTLKNVYSKYIQMSSFIIFPMVLLLCGIAKPLVLFLLTDAWAPCIGLLQVLCFTCLWTGIVIIKKTIAFIILGVSIIFKDIYAICIGSVVYSFCALYLNTIYTKSILNLGFLRQCAIFGPYLAIAVISMSVALLFSYTIDIPIVSLILSCTICTCLYLWLSKKLNLYAYCQTKEILRQTFQNKRLRG